MMERDVNIKFIYIILILLLALVGTSVFYQIRYNDMKTGYERSFENFNHTLINLTIKQKDLYSNISEINVSADRELALAAKLETRTLELEEISRELASLKQELFECQQNYDTVSTSCAVSNKILQRLIGTLKYDVENGANETVIQQDFKNIDTELKAFKS
jgi:TPP-dependent trihydroxycyclohexane-1,2-dione (THcHDO) dehydratase